jgi:glycine cleavage system regulatory protein
VQTLLILTVIGADRPGIVESLSRIVNEHGGNWEASRMARLAGRFAGILEVSVPRERAAKLAGALTAMSAQGLKVVAEESEPTAVAEARLLKLELVGNDRPGIIREISRALASRGVNVEELSTECENAPMTGGNLFRLTAELRSPPGLSVDDLRHVLEEVGHDLMVEVKLG